MSERNVINRLDLQQLKFKTYLSLKEASALYGIGIHEMRKIFYEDKVPMLKIGRKTIIQNKGLDEYLDEVAKTTQEIR